MQHKEPSKKDEAGNNRVTIIKNIGFTREGYKNHHYIGATTSNLKNKTIMETSTGTTMPSKYNGSFFFVFFRKEAGAGGGGGGGKHRLQ